MGSGNRLSRHRSRFLARSTAHGYRFHGIRACPSRLRAVGDTTGRTTMAPMDQAFCFEKLLKVSARRTRFRTGIKQRLKEDGGRIKLLGDKFPFAHPGVGVQEGKRRDEEGWRRDRARRGQACTATLLIATCPPCRRSVMTVARRCLRTRHQVTCLQLRCAVLFEAVYACRRCPVAVAGHRQQQHSHYPPPE